MECKDCGGTGRFNHCGDPECSYSYPCERCAGMGMLCEHCDGPLEPGFATMCEECAQGVKEIEQQIAEGPLE